jgi:hypothetical protein
MSKNKYTFNNLVVYKGIVCQIRNIWETPVRYSLTRLYPLTGQYIDFDKVPESELSLWDGLADTKTEQ